MARVTSALLIAICCAGMVLADEPAEVAEPPKIVLDAPTAKQPGQPAVKTETITIYESKFLPGFRPCTPEDYRNQDYDPVACQDEEASRVLSTREADRQEQEKDLIIGDDVVPQGNIYKLRFERLKREKQ